MIDAYRRNFGHSPIDCAQDAPVSRDDVAVAINQHGIHEAELLDTGSNLANLLGAMNPWVRRPRRQLGRITIDDRQSPCVL
jgi:hypothetical protein